MTNWTPPEQSGDQLIEAKIVRADGTEHPIVVLLKPVLERGSLGYNIVGYSRSIDLPPGASLQANVPVPPGALGPEATS